MKIELLSALGGAALFGVAFVTAGSAQNPRRVSPNELTIGDQLTVRVVGIPEPRNMVVIAEGAPFTVPLGRLFVLTGLGKAGEGGPLISFTVDGQEELTVRMESTSGRVSIRAVPPGLSMASGSVAAVTGGGGDARAWGYLIDA